MRILATGSSDGRTDLIAPATRLHRAWLDSHAEWGPGRHEDGFGLEPDDEVESPAGFAAWVARLTAAERAHCHYRWIVEDGRVLGGIALRFGNIDMIRRAGHIGYGVRPSARGRGLATWALTRMLDDARDLGLDRLLVVCAPDNTASARTIERCGGVPEDPSGRNVLRYWIDV